MRTLPAVLGRVTLSILIAVAVGFLFLPLVSVFLSMPPTVMWHDLNTPIAYTALALSIKTSLMAVVLMVVLGLPTGYWIAKGKFSGRQMLRAAVQMPVVSPPAVAGVGLLLVFGNVGWLGRTLSVWGMPIAFNTAAVVLAQTFISAPFFMTAAIQAFETVNDQLTAASRTLGVSPWATFWRVTIPIASPGLVTGLALGWGRALGEFGATMMFAGNLPGKTQTLPLAIYTAMQSNMSVAEAMSALLMAVSFVLLVLVMLLAHHPGQGSTKKGAFVRAIFNHPKTSA